MLQTSMAAARNVVNNLFIRVAVYVLRFKVTHFSAPAIISRHLFSTLLAI